MSNFRIPGPTPYYDGVYEGLQKEMISHRSGDYRDLHTNIVEKLKPFFGTKKHIYLLTSSGTGGMEAAICNLFNPGDTIISFCIGVFGARWIRIAKAFGLKVVEVYSPMGKPVDLETVKDILQKNKAAKGVLITHNETSTGVLNPIEQFASICKETTPHMLVIVDSISVLGATPMKMDEWGIDFVTTSAQKAWSAPAGLCMIATSERAFETALHTTNARFYFDLRLINKYAQKNETPITPAVGSLFGLLGALTTMSNEGLDAISNRHIKLRNLLRSSVVKMGLALVVDDRYASPTVTAIYLPDDMEAKKLQSHLRENYDTYVAGGKGELEGKIIRIAHMGNVQEDDIEKTVSALKKSLTDLQ